MTRARVKPIYLRLFEAFTHPPFAYSRNELIAILYPDPDLEPEFAYSCMVLGIMRLRRWFREEGLYLDVYAANEFYRVELRREPRLHRNRQFSFPFKQRGRPAHRAVP